MDTKKYNGWTNYATWKVSLEMGITDKEDLAGWDAEELKDYVIDILYEENDSAKSLCRDFAFSFIQDVNWQELSDHLRETFGICKTCNEETENVYCKECENDQLAMDYYDRA